jgi:hypothetical protein
MFWRNDPKVGGSKGGGAQPDWPRNGAVLKGLVHELPAPVENCNRWLEVHMIDAFRLIDLQRVVTYDFR